MWPPRAEKWKHPPWSSDSWPPEEKKVVWHAPFWIISRHFTPHCPIRHELVRALLGCGCDRNGAKNNATQPVNESCWAPWNCRLKVGRSPCRQGHDIDATQIWTICHKYKLCASTYVAVQYPSVRPSIHPFINVQFCKLASEQTTIACIFVWSLSYLLPVRRLLGDERAEVNR